MEEGLEEERCVGSMSLLSKLHLDYYFKVAAAVMSSLLAVHISNTFNNNNITHKRRISSKTNSCWLIFLPI